MPCPVNGFFFKSMKTMVVILMMLKIVFSRVSEVEDLFSGACPGSKFSLFFSHSLFS